MAEFDGARDELVKNTGIIELSGCADSQKLHMFYGFSDGFQYKIIVTFHEQKAKEICEDYQFYDKQVCFYPAKDLIFYQADIRGNLLTKQRLKCLKALFLNEPVTIVTTFDAFMDHIVPLSVIRDHIIELMVGDTLDLKDFVRELTALGYERNYQVESEGQFSLRGGIVDIFPLTEENPIRIELWGDEIDSVRSFDILSQRSLEKMDTVTIFPATETVLTEEEKQDGLRRLEKDAGKFAERLRKDFKTEEAHRIKELVAELKEKLLELGTGGCNIESCLDYFYESHVSLFDYFDKEKTVFFLDEPARLYEKGSVVEQEFRESMEQRLAKGYVLPGQTDILYAKEEIFGRLEASHCISLSALQVRKGICRTTAKHSIAAKAMNSYNNSFEALVSDLRKYKKNGYRVILLSASRTRAVRLSSDIREQELSSFFTEDYDHTVKPGEIMVAYGRIRQGFEYPMLKFVVISESDIFTAQKKKRPKRKKYEGQKIQNFSELSVGDFVVHESHGLGIYKGIEQVTVDKVTKDYMKIEYRDGGNLYIPATALDAIQKYASKSSSRPRLNKLGGTEWTKTKAKVKSAVDVIASDLVELYAVRREKSGYQFSRDTVWQTEFEELFPFEETEDQLLAIDATKQDMESSKIMDRLICGDVGYGKTEIAIRAAFKAVQDGKQVVYLVPTTILAQQHY
ncbi:MAG TPA: CarD family transcriptional regulator, partial [Lachnospiraceae bacterium]|nr:CarD family transcriptional regulator [Lachnospiraceae bacterium]